MDRCDVSPMTNGDLHAHLNRCVDNPCSANNNTPDYVKDVLKPMLNEPHSISADRPPPLVGPSSPRGAEPSSTASSQNGQQQQAPQVAQPQEESGEGAQERCGNCGQEFTDMQSFWSHDCSVKEPEPEMDGVLTDVESFDGKIVYNPDGSAFIIEGESDLSETESILDLPKLEGSIVDHRGKISSPQSYPLIANAFYIQRNPNPYYNTFYMFPAENRPQVEAPIMHSYKVYDLRRKSQTSSPKVPKFTPKLPTSVPTKPVLMCFICKLSFGYVKSFVAHWIGEHNMNLNGEEKEAISRKNTSAIIQGVGRDKEPLMSFLEPILLPKTSEAPDKHSAMETDSAQPITAQRDRDGASSRSSPRILTSPDNHHRSQTPSQEMPNGFLEHSKEWPSPHSSSSPSNSRLPALDGSLTDTSPASHGIIIRSGCDEHPHGNITGIDCAKCDAVLGASRSMGNHMTMMHSRNSCKTLKCPKCNWHYKYQETLEIHMKEKHPDTETQCVYCITNQSHPRLARGEVYTCGYKPYRCEICNYSTTTKGNLSIHMQSDKHINNMQELHNGASDMSPMPPSLAPQHQSTPNPSPPHSQSAPSSSTPVSSSSSSNKKDLKQKPTWRCDVCNYETNVARNLRIHMTSEKHTYNMMVLQQNVKHMQRDMQFQLNQMAMMGSQDQAMMAAMSANPQLMPGMPPMSFDQAMFMTPLPGTHEIPMDLSKLENGGVPQQKSPGSGVPMDIKNNNQEASQIFQCFVCNAFSTDSLEKLHQHMQIDRSKQNEQDAVSVVGGTYMCNLCTYKTNLKANFQLHCKTDKHLQKLMLVNHIREGGPANEWRIKYMNVSNPVQVRCNACDYYTNSIHKLQLHVTNIRHDANAKLFHHLLNEERKLGELPRFYQCSLCQFNSKSRPNLIQHVRSLTHMRAESQKLMQLTEQGTDVMATNASFAMTALFHVKELNDDSIKFDELDSEEGSQDADEESQSKGQRSCPMCNFTCQTEMQLQTHLTSVHTSSPPKTPQASGSADPTDGPVYSCPLCFEKITDFTKVEQHLVQIHNLAADVLKKLLHLAKQTTSPQSTSIAATSPATSAQDVKSEADDTQEDSETMESRALKLAEEATADGVDLSDPEGEEQFRCQTCSKTFQNIDALYSHQNELGHLELKQTPRGPGYLCWKKGCNQYFKTAQALQVHFREIHAQPTVAVSERHVYKFRCHQCSLAFKTQEKLQHHSYYHIIRAATECSRCQKTFRTANALHRHVESTHFDSMTEAEKEEFKASVATSELLKLVDGEPNKEEQNESLLPYKEEQFMEDYINSQAIAENSYTDPDRKYKCHRCKVAFTKQSYLSAHNKTLMHRKGEKMSPPPVDRFNDPNRPYKCELCKESFTQKNILLVHFNSVSHLHKQKQMNIQADDIVKTEKEEEPSLMPEEERSEKDASGSSSLAADKKPYKCNICKVTYSQAATLDIHIRSVLHQTRASKIQELAMTGQVDLSQPLIEQPPDANETPAQEQHKKVLAEMLQQKMDVDNDSIAATPSSVDTPTPTGTPTPIVIKPIADGDQTDFICQKCGTAFDNPETMVSHLQNECYMQPGPGALRGMPRFRPAVQRNLLENIGFECVMQFNEYHQLKRKKREEQKEEEKEERNNNENGEEEPKDEEPKEIKKEEEKKEEAKIDMPEMNKCPCRICGKQFSSIWVLKAHEEDVHRQIMPIEMVEEFSGKYREDYDKRQPEPQSESVSASVSRSDTPNTSIKTEPSTTKDSKAGIVNNLAADLAAAQAAQMMHLPMFNMMGLGMPGMGMPMNNMGMMPPIMPMMMPMDGFAGPPGMPFLDPSLLMAQQQQQQQQAATAYASAQQQKRARTRINDEQLKILRAHFDIINSPTEEQIMEMSEKSGLPPKVIKHWFRNTLFKERQRNKDSPYNFSVPPMTQLNLEEYEKTGKVPATEEQRKEPKIKTEDPMMDIHDSQDNESVTSVSDSINSSAPSTPAPPSLPVPSLHPNVMSQVSYAELTAALSGMNTPVMALPNMTMNPRTPQSQTIRSNQTPPTPSSSLIGKRANRTRFTDYQIKVLQEYFEQNAYPKDDDLENLSKMLNLSPRVIVVWFQNARQKARKNYENQPQGETVEQDSSKFTRTPGLNYQCKKCFTVFQRYYELIKHQRTHCFKDENPSKDNSESDSSETPMPMPMPRKETLTPILPKPLSASSNVEYKCDKCTATFGRYDLWKEHQSMHQSTPKVAPSPFAPSSAFGMLQNIARQQQRSPELPRGIKQEDDLSFLKKRPLEEDDDDRDDQPRDKRMRTTILPEQLDYLYQKYQVDCNPSRKQLETIAHEVGLKKRVVQVWFQNTRARERKGQYRAHQQIIHKRCPFCRALFRAKSALESHLATKHAAEMAKGEVSVDSIPDEDPAEVAAEASHASESESPAPPLDMAKLLNNPYNVPTPFMPMVPPGLNDPLQSNMKRLYEDSLKKYLDELSHVSHQKESSSKPAATVTKSEPDEAPLDLSKPLPLIPKREEDARSETFSESTNDDCIGESNPSSPNSSLRFTPSKRYRTQMSSLQIRCMKHIFTDYKTPTMSECELLGREIGLPKRVVQVWFQNARAKEKKTKLAYSNTFGTEPETPRPAEECTLCGFKYSHKYTIQDHVFTKRHIDLMKSFVHKQGDDDEHKSWPSADALLPSPMQLPSSSASSSAQVADKAGAKKIKTDPSADHGHSEPSKRGAVAQPSSSAPAFMPPSSTASQVVPPFGMNFPPMPGPVDMGPNAMLPFMYPGMGGSVYPGMPMVPPGLMPGPESMFMYDASTFCTPLSLLQIPKAAIAQITAQVQEGAVSVTHYTQDSSCMADLIQSLDPMEAMHVQQASLDVGFICCKCHMVFPAQDACVTHQQMVCFPGKSPAELHKCSVKLEQRQYECKCCGNKANTMDEYKSHCQTEGHRAKVSTE